MCEPFTAQWHLSKTFWGLRRGKLRVYPWSPVILPGFISWLYHFLAGWPWASYLTSLSLSFSLCKIAPFLWRYRQPTEHVCKNEKNAPLGTGLDQWTAGWTWASPRPPQLGILVPCPRWLSLNINVQWAVWWDLTIFVHSWSQNAFCSS